MGALVGILGAVLIGKVAISAALSAALLSGVASVPVWIDLGGGVVQLVQLDAKLLRALVNNKKRPLQLTGVNRTPLTSLCFHGAPSAQAARFCP